MTAGFKCSEFNCSNCSNPAVLHQPQPWLYHSHTIN